MRIPSKTTGKDAADEIWIGMCGFPFPPGEELRKEAAQNLHQVNVRISQEGLMQSVSNDTQQLSLLRRFDRERPWLALDEKVQCALCDALFSGHDVRVIGARRALTRALHSVKLRCPTQGCLGGPGEWVPAEDPLISDSAWEDWDRLIQRSESDSEGEISPRAARG